MPKCLKIKKYIERNLVKSIVYKKVKTQLRKKGHDCVQKIQHKQSVELKLKASVFAKMAINTNHRKIFREKSI